MITFEVTIVCDGCKACLTAPSSMTPDRKTVIKLAKSRGWKIGANHTCPDCLKRRRR